MNQIKNDLEKISGFGSNMAWGATEKAWQGTKLLGKGLWKINPLNLVFFGPEAFGKSKKVWQAFGPPASKAFKSKSW